MNNFFYWYFGRSVKFKQIIFNLMEFMQEWFALSVKVFIWDGCLGLDSVISNMSMNHDPLAGIGRREVYCNRLVVNKHQSTPNSTVTVSHTCNKVPELHLQLANQNSSYIQRVYGAPYQLQCIEQGTNAVPPE